MFDWFLKLIGIKKEEVAKIEAKVEEAVKAATCGCGRSPTGFCVGLHKLSDEEWAKHSSNPNRIEAAAEAVAEVVEEKIVKAVKRARKTVIKTAENAEAAVEKAVKKGRPKKTAE